jgi:two-component system cell cycle sensor histidine kinase/response regulator CckA
MQMKDAIARGAHTILAVDELEAILTIVCEFLEVEGFAVLTAGDALEAIRIAEEYAGNIDLLLTDTRTRGMDGFVLAQRLKILLPAMGVILMSAMIDMAIEKKRIAKLHALFLWKPLTRRELLFKVNRSMARWSSS